jgi:hypothetical protein
MDYINATKWREPCFGDVTVIYTGPHIPRWSVGPQGLSTNVQDFQACFMVEASLLKSNVQTATTREQR